MIDKYDVVVVGAGIVGLTTALLLAQNNSELKIAIIEKFKPNFNWDSSSYDLRTSAINRASENVFKNIGVWDLLPKSRISPYTGMQVWDSSNLGKIDFNAQELLQSNLGHILENRELVKAAWMQLENLTNVDVFIAAIDKIEKNTTEVSFKLNIDENVVKKISAKLVVGADGANSFIRNQFAIDAKEYSYNQSAIVANVTTELEHKRIARQVFLPSGPIAFLPLQEAKTSAIVWSLPSSEAKKLCEVADFNFNDIISDKFNYKLGFAKVISERKSFPLKMIKAKEYCSNRVALVGDAAHVIHPLAGQGLNLGLLDAAKLAEILLAAYNNNKKDLGNYLLLRKYARARVLHNSIVQNAMTGFKSLFGSNLTIAKFLRTTGLNLLNNIPIAKKELMLAALGISKNDCIFARAQLRF